MWSGIQQRLRQRELLQPTRAWQARLSPRLTYAGAVAAVLVFGLATFSGYVNRGASLSLAPNSLGAAGFNRPFIRGDAFPLTSDSSNAAVQITDEEIERLAKVTPQRPTVVPAGYQFEASDLYRCNCCGCGGCAAILRYTDGKSRLYVLECRPDHPGCADVSHQDPATFGNPCLLCRLGKGSLVEAQSPSLRVAVIGDLPRQKLLAVAHSVKKE
jgi:anti-sigma factor RsiW